MKDRESVNRARMEGARAYHDGRTMDSNPYPNMPVRMEPEARAWRAGYMRAWERDA